MEQQHDIPRRDTRFATGVPSVIDSDLVVPARVAGVLLVLFAATMAPAMLLRRHPNAFDYLVERAVVIAADWRAWAALACVALIAILMVLRTCGALEPIGSRFGAVYGASVSALHCEAPGNRAAKPRIAHALHF